MKILIVFNKVKRFETLKNQPTFSQAELVANALKVLGHQIAYLPIDLNLEKLTVDLLKIKPDLIFNLVEALCCEDSLAHLAAAIYDSLKIPYTGNKSEVLFLTNNKLLAKSFYDLNGIKTPEIINPGTDFEPPFIIKPIWNHGSEGITKKSIINNVIKKEGFFVERFIEGKEFTVSIIGNNSPVVLPIRTYKFSDTPILDYKSKWKDDSDTISTCNLDSSDLRVAEKLKIISLNCWEKFNLRGYARLDFRVDKFDQPYLLEINANPSLEKFGALYKSAKYANMNINQVIEKIIER